MPNLNKKYTVVTVEAVIGLKFWPNQFHEEFSFINGLTKRPKIVRRLGLAALGVYQPHDIGKRVYGNQVENDEQITKRTRKSFEVRKKEGLESIKAAKLRYKGCKDILGNYI